VRYAKDQLSAVLKRVRSGEPQFIGDEPDAQVLIISVADLAALCQASAQTLTFGEVLARVGFQPQRMPESARLVIRQRPLCREKLTIERERPGQGLTLRVAQAH
jgi:antitoxin (DNA-binding transcriptional repressor) of toxin-antitoxin stability system